MNVFSRNLAISALVVYASSAFAAVNLTAQVTVEEATAELQRALQSDGETVKTIMESAFTAGVDSGTIVTAAFEAGGAAQPVVSAAIEVGYLCTDVVFAAVLAGALPEQVQSAAVPLCESADLVEAAIAAAQNVGAGGGVGSPGVGSPGTSPGTPPGSGGGGVGSPS